MSGCRVASDQVPELPYLIVELFNLNLADSR